jgi:leucyl-tRNA synthetase
MVYYTISHLLHTDIFGKVKGEADVDPEQLTDEVFDAIFCGHEIDDELLAASKIPKDTLLRLRR